MKKVSIKLLDKIMLPSILKKEANYETMIINLDIKKKVEVTQDELLKYNIKSLENGGLTWNKEGSEAEFELEFTEMEASKIKEALKELNDSNKLTEELINLYKIFVL